MIIAAWIAAGLALVALTITLINALTWARGAARGEPVALTASVSVLVPARNEEATIGDTVSSVLDAGPRPTGLRVCDDGSTDATPGILAELSRRDDLLEVIGGSPLPVGWIGKPWACHQLASGADTDVLLFVDADVRLAPDALAQLEALAERHGADVVTAVPRQRTGTFAEGLVMPLLHATYTCWLPLALIPRVRDPRVLAANGQVLWVRRAAWDRIGGFEAVRHEVVDDMAFCRRAKERGLRVLFVDGHELASCRMYGSAVEVWRGFSKNLYEGIGGHPLALLGVIALYGTAFVLPWALAIAAAVAGSAALLMPALIGIGAGLTMRAVLAARHSHPWWSVPLHPAAVVVLLAIAVNSFVWHARGTIAWAGRVYAPRARRLTAGGRDAG